MSYEEGRLSETLGHIADLYEKSLDDHGPTARGVGWKDEASHLLRFEKLAQVIDVQQASAGMSVNDLGCGYGALFRYLDDIPKVQLSRYYGYDISKDMLRRGQQSIADPRAEFVESPRATHEADYSFVSGTFNVRLEASNELWTEYIKETLLDLAANSARGLAFNLLTSYVDWRQENLYYADPLLFFDFCIRNISRYVSLLHDYPLFEWTMLVYQGGKLR